MSDAVEVSLHDQLAAAYDAQEGVEAPETAGEVQEEVEPVGEEPIELEVSESDEETTLSAPDHWPADRKAIFAELTPSAQQAWLDRETEFERGIQEKSQNAAQYRQQLDRYNEIVEPIRQQLAMFGQDEYQWMRQMAGYTQMLNTDPVGVIKAVAQQYGVDLSSLSGQSSEEFVDPQVQELRDQINNLQRQIQEREEHSTRQATESQTQAIESFRSAKDASGNLLHPHFDAVFQDLIVMAQGYVASGQKPPELQSLYERAVLMHPELTAQDQQKAQAEAERKRKEEEAKKAKRARSAGAGARSSVADGGETKAPSLKEELLRNYDAQVGGS